MRANTVSEEARKPPETDDPAIVLSWTHKLQVVADGVTVSDESLDFPATGLIDPFICIEDQDPVARGVAERLVPRCREVLAPLEMEHFRFKALGKRHGPVSGAGVHDDDLIHERLSARQAVSQIRLLVLYDHAEAQGRISHETPRQRSDDIGPAAAPPRDLR